MLSVGFAALNTHLVGEGWPLRPLDHLSKIVYILYQQTREVNNGILQFDQRYKQLHYLVY